MSNPSHNNSSSKGIDFRAALKILSTRAASQDHDTENHPATFCSCVNVGETMKTMGQVVNIHEKLSDVAEHDDSEEASVLDEKQRHELDMERLLRRAAIQEKLESMSTKELLNTVLEVQEQRVATYRTYDRALEGVLQTRNLSHYPQACAEATASFAVLSDTIQVIQSVLGNIKESHSDVDLSTLVKTLQVQEKKKLNLTAALHLERIREQGQQDVAGGDERILSLLRQGVSSLQEELVKCVDDINDTIDEIKCVRLEIEEGDYR